MEVFAQRVEHQVELRFGQMWVAFVDLLANTRREFVIVDKAIRVRGGCGVALAPAR